MKNVDITVMGKCDLFNIDSDNDKIDISNQEKVYIKQSLDNFIQRHAADRK